MAQFVAFAPDVEVNGQTILSFVNALPNYKEMMNNILAKHDLKNVDPEGWYAQQLWLDAFKEIGEKFGSNTLFAIGKVIPENAIFPKEIDTLEKALSAIDIAYHMNHRNGEIGYYQLVDFAPNHRLAIMECRNPYPSPFDRGIIMTMARRFKPMDSLVVKVELDENTVSRLNGGDSCTYRVTW